MSKSNMSKIKLFNLSGTVMTKWQGEIFFFLCIIMTNNFLELATTLKYLGAKWLPKK